MPLIAFNVYLGTKDVRVAKRIAKTIRFAGGGLRYVKALGFDIKEREIVQISMNLVNFLGTPIFRVFEMIKSEAQRYGVPIVSSEIVGLTPMDAMVDVADFYLRLENFKRSQVLENKLMNIAQEQKGGLMDFIEEVASDRPVPGGGSVAATSGALSAALLSMVCGLTIGKRKYQEVEEELKEVLKKIEKIKGELKELVIKDADSYQAVMDARKLTRRNEIEEKRGDQAVQEATKLAASVPLKVMEKSLELLNLSKIVAEKGNANAVSDAGVAALMAKAAILGAGYNVKINLGSLEDENFVEQAKKTVEAIEKEAENLSGEVMKKVEERL
jgi:glutamate formiminotransferase/formiminotetrahydrofolate cyclodeaminase